MRGHFECGMKMPEDSDFEHGPRGRGCHGPHRHRRHHCDHGPDSHGAWPHHGPFGPHRGPFGHHHGPFGHRHGPFGHRHGPFGHHHGPFSMFGPHHGPFGPHHGWFGPHHGPFGKHWGHRFGACQCESGDKPEDCCNKERSCDCNCGKKGAKGKGSCRSKDKDKNAETEQSGDETILIQRIVVDKGPRCYSV